MQIIKRTGKHEEYQPEKIKQAITLAFQSTGNSLGPSDGDYLLASVDEKIRKKTQGQADISVEEIQDLVEQTLMESGHYPEAKRYILYREDRTRKRSSRQGVMTA